MKANHETLAEELDDYERELRGLTAYVQELKAKTTEHGTDTEHFEADLLEAEHNVEYYKGEVARIKELIGEGTDGAAYVVFQDAAGEWRWQLRAANNRIIADSGEGYRNKQDCLHGITLVKNAKNAPVKERE